MPLAIMKFDKGIFGNKIGTRKQTEPIKEKADSFKGTFGPIETVGFLRNQRP